MIRPDILTAITAEIDRARAKYGAVSMSSPFIADAERVRILTAEVVEVEQAVSDLDIDGAHGIRAELTQVAACAIAWLSTLPVPAPKAQCCGYGECGPDCLCDDAALCVGTCSNPEHEGRGEG